MTNKRLAAAYIGACFGVPLGLLSISFGVVMVVEFIFFMAVMMAVIVVFILALATLSTP